MNGINIIPTTAADEGFIYRLFDDAIQYQLQHGYPAWKGYDKKALQAEIARQLQYKIVKGTDILGIFSISYNDPEIWAEWDTGQALFLHRTITNPAFKGQQVFALMRNWAVAFAREKQLHYIRMDTWADNLQLIAYYQKYGFRAVANRVTSNAPELPGQNRNLRVTLLELLID